MVADDIQSKAADLMKKVLTVGVGAIFLTEESMRGLVSEFKLPKELLAGILESAGKTKDDFLQKLSAEVIDRVKDKMDPRQLIDEILAKHEIDIQIRLKFNPKEKK